jgi:hypothetical protein
MRIDFFDDPLQTPKPPEELRFKQVGFYVHEGGRRISVGFDLLPFLQRPSVEVWLYNAQGELAASLSVIEVLQTNFSMTMHLRDQEPTDLYTAKVELYYNVFAAGEPTEPASPDEPQPLPRQRMAVDSRTIQIDVTQPGEHLSE